MCRKYLPWAVLGIVMLLAFAAFADSAASYDDDRDDCTIIAAGKDATVDGSVIVSHSMACTESRLHVVPAQDFPPGTLAPVYWGMAYFGIKDSRYRPGTAYDDYGEILGYIPQVEHTYAYFHTGYPQMNEHQLAIGESTIACKPQLNPTEKVSQQIMSIEQAQVFAMQRCTTARAAVRLIGSLMETYGFIPSSGEALAIADTKEVWIFEVFGVGPFWDKASGKPGAVWAAERVPDDHVAYIANHSIIKEIDLSNPDYFMASGNYMQLAIDFGWYDPASGLPFIWQDAYSPRIRQTSFFRMCRFFADIAPTSSDWPNRKLAHPSIEPLDAYNVPLEDASWYPFSIKPEKKLSVEDVIANTRKTTEGTVYDMSADPDWFVPDGKGGFAKSPLANPFPTNATRYLLDIPMQASEASPRQYGMVAQVRGWLPDSIGGVYWFVLDNPYTSIYVPIRAGVQEINPLYNTYDLGKFSEDSAQWVIDFVDNLLYLNWQEGIQYVRAVRDPLEARFLSEQAGIDAAALALYAADPKAANEYLTRYAWDAMDEVVQVYRDLRELLITKFTNDQRGTPSSW